MSAIEKGKEKMNRKTGKKQFSNDYVLYAKKEFMSCLLKIQIKS